MTEMELKEILKIECSEQEPTTSMEKITMTFKNE